MTKFNITIISDTVCPWCYIGYRRLRVAMSQHLENFPTDAFSITWHPFQLNPRFPKGTSMDKSANYEEKFGSEQRQMVFDRLKSAAKDVGIEFKFGGRIGNTLDSHRLIEFAQDKDQSENSRHDQLSDSRTRLVEQLFGDYFEREQDITDHGVLTQAAVRAGLDEDEVKAFLRSDKLAREVEEKANESRDQGINGVPHFDINGVFTVEGAQEPAAFLMLFNRLKKREAAVL